MLLYTLSTGEEVHRYKKSIVVEYYRLDRTKTVPYKNI